MYRKSCATCLGYGSAGNFKAVMAYSSSFRGKSSPIWGRKSSQQPLPAFPATLFMACFGPSWHSFLPDIREKNGRLKPKNYGSKQGLD
jgi:hypothetical protein